MRILEPAVDAYGSYARASALADFVELWALHGVAMTRADVADYIEDNGWGSKIHETFVSFDEDSDEHAEDTDLGDDGESVASRVFEQIEARKAYLEEDYPFALDGQSGILDLTGSLASPYLVILAVTIAHAYDLPVSESKPHQIFEETVARALGEAGHSAVNFAKIRGSASGFVEALAAAGDLLSLRATATGTYFSKWAKDEGADSIAQVSSGFSVQGGVGAWALVGQATCGKSNTWSRKLSEVKERAWQVRLDTIATPMAFLAVPHHVEASHINRLVSESGRLVLDRLRIASMLRSVSDSETSTLDVVRNVSVAGK